MKSYKKAAQDYIPTDKIRLLFITESPPKPKDEKNILMKFY